MPESEEDRRQRLAQLDDRIKQLEKDAEESSGNIDELLAKYANQIDPQRPEKYHRKYRDLVNEGDRALWDVRDLTEKLAAAKQKVLDTRAKIKQLEEDYEKGRPIL